MRKRFVIFCLLFVGVFGAAAEAIATRGETSDVDLPDDPCFEAANVLPAMGKWELPKTFFFRPDEIVAGPDGRRMTRRELAIARLREMDQAEPSDRARRFGMEKCINFITDRY